MFSIIGAQIYACRHTENDVIFKKASNEFENTDTANPVNSRVLDFSKHGVKSPYGYPKKDLTSSWVSKLVILSSSLKH